MGQPQLAVMPAVHAAPDAPDAAPSAPLGDTVGHLTRAGEWWASLVGLLLAVAYLQILLADISFGDAITTLGALLASCSLLAAYANLLNDLTDIDQDRASGRSTGAMRLGRPLSTVLVVALAVAGLLPWLVVSLSPAATVALAGIVVLPLVYSLPGIRFKERGGLGVVTDALFEHAVPTAFIVLLFRPDREPSAAATVLDAALVVGAFATGLRGIVGHQLLDLEADRAAGVRSWVGSVGAERATRAVQRWVFPLECTALAAVVALVALEAPLVAALAAASGLLIAEARRVHAWDRRLQPEPSPDPEVRWVLWKYYRVWPATFALVGLVASDPRYLALAAVHLLLFRTAARQELASVGFYGRQLAARWAERARIRWHAFRMARDRALESFRWKRHHTGVAIVRGWNHTWGWWLRTRGHLANLPRRLLAFGRRSVHRVRRAPSRVPRKLARAVGRR